MEAQEIQLDGIQLIKPKVFTDSRGLFLESYQEPRYREMGINCSFVQDNHSVSKQSTIRGMHFQSHPGQSKLVRVALGRIFDVVVDLRQDSPTFGKWQGFYLDSTEHHQLFIPVGFAHGFCVISEEAHVLYKVSAIYDAETEHGFRWDDPDIAIEWPVSDPVISDRDLKSPFFRELDLNSAG